MRPLHVILDRFDNGKAVFLTQEGQQLFWNRDDLPEDIKEGQSYYVHFATQATETPVVPVAQVSAIPIPPIDPQEQERKKLARTILEEILNGSNQPTTPGEKQRD